MFCGGVSAKRRVRTKLLVQVFYNGIALRLTLPRLDLDRPLWAFGVDLGRLSAAACSEL